MENTVSREDYIEVSERIQRFYEKYPDGSLQGSWTWMGPGHDVIVFRAEAFRSQEDTRPGIGHASEPYPGLTSFTKNSEMMNAETSAWGRAIASLGIAVHRGIASAQEVRAAAQQEAREVPRMCCTLTPLRPWRKRALLPRPLQSWSWRPKSGQLPWVKPVRPWWPTKMRRLSTPATSRHPWLACPQSRGGPRRLQARLVRRRR